MKLIPDLTVIVEFFETPRGRASLKRLPNVSVDYRDARSGEHGYRRMMQLAHTQDLRYTRFRNVPFPIREGNEKRIRSFAVALLSFDHEISEGEVREAAEKISAHGGPWAFSDIVVGCSFAGANEDEQAERKIYLLDAIRTQGWIVCLEGDSEMWRRSVSQDHPGSPFPANVAFLLVRQMPFPEKKKKKAQ